MVTSSWGSWIQGHSQLGERMGCMSTSCWGRGWFLWLLTAEKLVSGLLPAGGEDGLHEYSPLGERVVLWLLPAGEVSFRVTPHWGRGWVT